jgi:EAL domain-containing protein (putative c-di-GMP-specific phosphodiesterase class I)
MQMTADRVENLFFSDKSYSCEYQPLISLDDGEIVGYEALSRFAKDGKPVPPNQIFGKITDIDLLFQIESRITAFQIDNRPVGLPLFTNIDPLCFSREPFIEYWVKYFDRFNDIYVEITDTLTDTSVKNVAYIIKKFNKHRTHIGLDNIGGTSSLVSFDLIAEADFLKLHRDWFKVIRKDKATKKLLEGIVEFAEAKEKIVVLEGVETREDFKIAESLHVDYVQGFLFKNKFITKKQKQQYDR